MLDTQELYNQWRKELELSTDEDVELIIDCEVEEIREDFSLYAGLKEITVKEMLDLENNYK